MVPPFQGKERRRYLRVHPAQTNPVHVAVQMGDTVLEADAIRDVSLGGVAFQFPWDSALPPIGKKLAPIQLKLPELGTVEARGVVRRYDRPAPDAPPVLAVEFTSLPYSGEKKLFQYINQRHRELRYFTGE